jgi:serine/threonine protein kinase
MSPDFQCVSAAKPVLLAGYEILDKLGEGGMGTVFRARQVSLDRVVALKLLVPQLAADEQYVASFIQEAKAAGRLSHPNIIRGRSRRPLSSVKS